MKNLVAFARSAEMSSQENDRFLKCKKCRRKMDRLVQRVYEDGYYGEICDKCWKRKQKEVEGWDTAKRELPPKYYD